MENTIEQVLHNWSISGEGLIDFREESDFYSKHILGSTSLPWSVFKLRGFFLLIFLFSPSNANFNRERVASEGNISLFVVS
jgi:hypothetical protein